MMKKLYSLTATADIKKSDLYIRQAGSLQGMVKVLHRGEKLDFLTYFNSFSIKKWQQYTTIQSVIIEIELQGRAEIVVSLHSLKKEKIISRDITTGTTYRKVFDINELQGDILSFSIQAVDDLIQYFGGSYYGEFSQWRDRKIGCAICTFKREKYVLKTIDILRRFKEKNDWLHILVIDNGRTLVEQNTDGDRIIHNRNFGGSGGFTRAMIEYVDEGIVDYILLMDDDIVLDSSVLERTYSLLCSLREQYLDSFLSGSMLILEHPHIQYEKTAYWDRIRLYGIGKNKDVSQKKVLISNEIEKENKNQYGAWWYCCIPIHRIKQIGYPIPVFIKGDDIEYGIRNHRPVLSMNGICVWHQSFLSKMTPVVNYYSDRNMLIINNFAENCGWITFSMAVMGRVTKRILQHNLCGLAMLYLALKDYNQGFEGITCMGADEKMEQVRQYANLRKNISIIPIVLVYAIRTIFIYPKIHLKYIDFKINKLVNSKFWKNYLQIRRQ